MLVYREVATKMKKLLVYIVVTIPVLACVGAVLYAFMCLIAKVYTIGMTYGMFIGEKVF